jgi:N-acetylmuramic acid 6-phosphate etherase
MIDVKPTNVKLQIRARRILRQICGDQCPSTDAELDAILQEADKSVKLAAAMILLDIGVNEARAKLEEVDGVLSLLLRGSQGSANSHVRDCVTKVPLVLCVDGGGSKCRATIAAVNGQTWTGEAGPCNPSDLGVEGAIGAIDQAVQAAINSYSTTSGLRMEHINFSKVWVGLAGIDREPTRSRIRLELEKLLGEPSCSNMAVSNDLELLATIGGHRFGAKDVIVLVAGTGSIAMRYNIQGNKCQKVARVGGWGALLGDDGSGFDIGKKTIRMVLAELDRGANISDFEEAVDPLSRLVMDHFRPATIPADWNDLLNAILLGERQDKQPASYVKQRIAGLAEVIVSLVNVSHKASKIVDDAVRGLSDLVSCVLARPSASQRNTVLVVAGGLMQSNVVRSKLCVKLVDEKIYSGRIESVEDLATSGALFLAQEQGRGSAVVGSA